MTREEAIKEYIMPALKRTWNDDRCIEIISAIERDPYEVVLNKIRAEIDRQQKWLLQAGYTAYNVDIALDAIKAVVAEKE